MKKKKGTKNKKASTQDEAGLATGGVSLPTRRGIGTSRWGNRLWGGLLLLLLFLMLKLIRTIIICLLLAILLSSLVPHQGSPRVVEGGQLRLGVLGKEDGLLAPSQWSRGLTA